MPNIPSITFDVKFDLTGVPSIVLTDGTTYPVGAVGRFIIKQPDGYTRTGTFTTPDIVSSGDIFSMPVRLSSKGTLQKGQYTVTYEIKELDDTISAFTRVWQMTYAPVDLVMREEFDVFSPRLRYFDDTIYQVSNYDAGAITRLWEWDSTPTGPGTDNGVEADLVSAGDYFDANYTVQLESSMLYTHQVYAWLTVDEKITKQVATYAETPPTVGAIVSLIKQLKDRIENAENTMALRNKLIATFQYAQSLFEHIIDRVQAGDTDGIYVDIQDLIVVLHNYQIPTYIPLNIPIEPYSFGGFISGGGVWGAITGTITNQADLVNYIANLFSIRTTYGNIGDGVATEITVAHSFFTKNVVVTLLEEATGERVETTWTASEVGVTFKFKYPPTTDQYTAIIKI